MGTRSLATVVLRHTSGAEVHYDWMIQQPDTQRTGDPDARHLATWRIDSPPSAWQTGDRVAALAIGDHRMAYLTYEGELSGGRGRVDRVASGTARAVSWAASGALLEVSLGGFSGRVQLRREGDAEAREGGEQRWTLTVLERHDQAGMMK